MKDNLQDFLKDFQSLTIHSLDEKEIPFSSYAPFVQKNNKYYVFLSSMAKHSKNLENNESSSIFFIEDEKTCKNIFARKRVVFQTKAKKILRDKTILDEFKKKFNKEMIESLESMSDFSLYEFTPIYGEAVFGFGRAYNIDIENLTLVQRIDLKGHGHSINSK